MVSAVIYPCAHYVYPYKDDRCVGVGKSIGSLELNWSSFITSRMQKRKTVQGITKNKPKSHILFSLTIDKKTPWYLWWVDPVQIPQAHQAFQLDCGLGGRK